MGDLSLSGWRLALLLAAIGALWISTTLVLCE